MLVSAQGIETVSLENAGEIQQLISEERESGNAEVAWNLEQRLLGIAVVNRNDARSAEIFRAAGDHRSNILARYDEGETPAELILGCYYKVTGDFGETLRFGMSDAAASSVLFDDNNSCEAGGQRTARRALALEIMWLYVESARISLRSEGASDDDVQEALNRVVAESYRFGIYDIGRSSLESLLGFQEAISASWVEQAQTLAYLGDWDLLFASNYGTRLHDLANASYEQAIELLVRNEVDQETIDSMFSPRIPIVLPAFRRSALRTRQSDGFNRYIDIAFEIRNNGKSARIKVLDSSPNAPRDSVRDVSDTVKGRLFRPIAADGQIQDRAPVTVRYYVSD
jgi:hypothetical protein